MKRIYFIGLIVMVLLCFIGFTQNEFTLETNTTMDESISAEITFNPARVWDTVNLDIASGGILHNTLAVFLIKNDGNFLNSVNYIKGTDQYAISQTAKTQNYKDEFASTYSGKTDDTLGINRSTGIAIGADILKYPTYSISAG